MGGFPICIIVEDVASRCGGLLMARTRINGRDCPRPIWPRATIMFLCRPGLASYRTPCYPASLPGFTARLYIPGGVSRRRPASQEIDGVGGGKMRGRNRSPVSDIPSISTLHPKISLNLPLARLPTRLRTKCIHKPAYIVFRFMRR